MKFTKNIRHIYFMIVASHDRNLNWFVFTKKPKLSSSSNKLFYISWIDSKTLNTWNATWNVLWNYVTLGKTWIASNLFTYYTKLIRIMPNSFVIFIILVLYFQSFSSPNISYDICKKWYIFCLKYLTEFYCLFSFWRVFWFTNWNKCGTET